jgi:hypothetical protein
MGTDMESREMSDRGMETPSDDALEQQRDVVETDEEPGEQRPELPFDANEADAAEQERTVEDDEDDYR